MSIDIKIRQEISSKGSQIKIMFTYKSIQISRLKVLLCFPFIWINFPSEIITMNILFITCVSGLSLHFRYYNKKIQ